MKIISLQAENVKKLSAVEIVPKANLVQITGRNGQGKTSVLDSIWWALAGAGNIQSQPVRAGEEQAIIRLDLGTLKVTRKLGKGASLTVENGDGAVFKSPQGMLTALLGELTFDPLAFMKMKPEEQADELKRIAKLGDEIDELDSANKTDFEARTALNRTAKDALANAAAITVPEGLPAERVNTAKLIDDLQAAGTLNAEIEKRKTNRQNAVEQIAADRQRAQEIEDGIEDEVGTIITHWDAQIAETRDHIKRLQDLLFDQQQSQIEDVATVRRTKKEEASALKKGADDLQARLDAAEPLPDIIDVAALRQSIAASDAINKGVDQAATKATWEAKANEAEMSAEALTKAMDARKAKKLELIAAASMPVPGLGLGDGQVLFNGIPLDQASSAEQLRVSVAIAMAANPKLRVLRIKDGSLLDDDGLALLGTMAAENDFQVWLEKVDSSGKIGIVIEDGHVASDNQITNAAE